MNLKNTGAVVMKKAGGYATNTFSQLSIQGGIP